MIISRGYNCVKLIKNANNVLKPSINNVINRSSGRWVYRAHNIATKGEQRVADIFGGCVWGWILYHCINDYGHVIGEYDAPDPSLWTDEELGIPPDDAEPAN